MTAPGSRPFHWLLSTCSLLGLGMHNGRIDPRPSWCLWFLVALLAVLFMSMKEIVWAFLAIWMTVAVVAPALARRSADKIVPAGALLLGAIPMLIFALAILLGVDPSPYGEWENLLATIGFYTVAFLTFLCLCIGTEIRLNWALLNWSVVFLSMTLCALAIILEFLSDYYFGSNYLGGDNVVAMIQLTWAYFGSIVIGFMVKRYARSSLSVYQPYWKKVSEGQS
jgi:hypothetical protein